MLKVGLTGGIASGKSTVLSLFHDFGIPTLSADEVVHTLLSDDPTVYNEIVSVFGSSVVNGEGRINRRILGQVVFDNPEKRRYLEAVLHPKVVQHTLDWFSDHRDQSIVIVEMPLLYEAGLTSLFDTVVVVSSEHRMQENRLLSKGISLEEANKRINAQMPLGQKAEMADYTIHNTGSLDQLRDNVCWLYDQLKSRANAE